MKDEKELQGTISDFTVENVVHLTVKLYAKADRSRQKQLINQWGAMYNDDKNVHGRVYVHDVSGK